MVLVHAVYHKFKADVSPERILEHYATEVRLKERMPDIVIDWQWGPNLSLQSRSQVNQGFSHVVVVKLKDEAALEAYLPHPEHVKLKELQAPLLDKIMVMDWIEGEGSMAGTTM